MKKLFDEFISIIQEKHEENTKVYCGLFPNTRAQFYLMMISFASNAVDTMYKEVKANETCKVILYHRDICKEDNTLSEIIMHSWYDDNELYIKFFNMFYNTQGILDKCEEEDLISINKKRLECINMMIKKIDTLNCYNCLPNCQEGLSLLSDLITYS